MQSFQMKKKLKKLSKYNFSDLFPTTSLYDDWSAKPSLESDEDKKWASAPPIPLLEGDKSDKETIAKKAKLGEQKTGTGNKILTSNNVLTRPPILLAENKSWK